MLSRAPGNLPPLIINQATASSADSNKRFCKAWPSNGRADSLLEPTSVLDIRSPSPSSTLSSSFAGSYEGGLPSIESGAVAVSRLLCEAASDGHLPETACLIDTKEVSAWASTNDNGSASEEDFPLGMVAVSGWNGDCGMGGELNRRSEQISHYQCTGVVGVQENVEGPLSGMNGGGPSAADASIRNCVLATFGSSVNRSSTAAVAQGKQVQWGEREGFETCENTFKEEKVEQFSFPISSNVLTGGSRVQAGQEVMNGEALGRLDSCVISYYQAEPGRKREQGNLLGEAVQQRIGSGSGGCGVVGRPVGEEEWLSDWNDVHAGEVTEKAAAAAQLGGMEDLEVLLGTSAPPPHEWWLADCNEDPPLILQQLVQPSQIGQQGQAQGGLLVGHAQRRVLNYVGGGGASSNDGGVAARRQLDLHEAMQAGLLVSSATSSGPASELGGTFPCHPPCTSFAPSRVSSSANFSSIASAPALSRTHSSPLAPQIELPTCALPPHHTLAAHFDPSPLKLQRHPSLPLLQQPPRQPATASTLFPPFTSDLLLPSDSKLALPHHQSPSLAAAVGLSAPHTTPCFNSTPLFLPQLPREFPHLPSEQLPRSQLFSLPYAPPISDQLVGPPKIVHRVEEAEFLHENLPFQGKLEPGWHAPRQRSEELFHRLIKSPPPSRKVPLDELVLAARQLSLAADAVDEGNVVMAQAILARLNQQNSPEVQPSQRAVFHFKEALAKRVAGAGSSFYSSSNSSLEVINKISAYKSLCEISPLAQFAHFTANQVILEAVEGEDHVHVIDFELELGGQWASFMQELSQRSKGPPALRITTIGSDSFEMQLAKENLFQFAGELNIPLEFYALPLESLSANIFPRGEEDAVAVNFGCGLDRLFSNFSSADSLTAFLQFMKGLSPKVVTVVDNEWLSEGSPPFLNALQYYASLFESLEYSKLPIETVLNIETFLFAPKIASAVNGKKRTDNWRSLLQKAGFNPTAFSNAAERQAQYLIGGPNTGFTFDKKHNSLLLGWHNRPLLSVSAWIC